MAQVQLLNTTAGSRSLHRVLRPTAARPPPALCLPPRARARSAHPHAIIPRQQARQAVRLHALGKMGKFVASVPQLMGAVGAIDGVWKKYDTNGDGSLSLDEATALLNSDELGDFVEKATNVRPLQRTREQVAALFEEADADNNKKLSKPEFAALYLKLVAQRVKTDPKVLLQTVLGTIDWNRDGSINGTELKRLLRLAGVPLLLAAPIPDGVDLNYSKVTSLLGLPPPTPQGAQGDAAPPAGPASPAA